ncbi:porin [Polynucleobacter necessarius]|uniref:porin n=1 Tax=Polynucleobacter necessarius TaxID=576610 RepID=UPI000E09716C|nr:porin [Polynucleobacter necessarius]
MKKSLFALAALTAVAGAAQAQSSVTVYGILDAGWVGGNSKLSGPNATPQNQAGTWSKFSISGAEATSRLGFKGTEDIGGGTSAFFTAEMSLTGDSTAPLGSVRQMFVGLKKNGIGAGSIGTVNTIIHNAVAVTDPGAHIAGNVYATNTGATATPDLTNYGQSAAYTVRTANTLALATDTFAGFSLNANYTQNGANVNQQGNYNISGGSSNGGSTNFTGWGLGANYAWQKLYATANYQALRSVQPYGSAATASNPYSAADAIWSNSLGGVNTQDNQAYIAATYDFGILKAYGQWVSRKATAVQFSNFYAKRTAQQLGVRSFITPTVEAWASLGNGRYTAFGNGQPTANFTGYQLGGNYYLSKRTNLYAIYGSTETSSVSTQGSASQNNYAVGVKHTF